MRSGLRLGLVLAALGCASTIAAQTADELIAKNIEARGGIEKMRAIQSMRLIGTLSIGDTNMPAALEVKRPNKTRLEFTLKGQTAIQAYDGTVAWAVVPFSGDSKPERMSAEDSQDMELQADMDGPLVDYRAKGHQVELRGLEKLPDGEAWRLKLALRGGETRDFYLDLKTNLQVRSVAHHKIQGKDVEVETEIGDYRESGGVLLPLSFETKAKGAFQKQSVRFDKIELNVPIEDSRFRMPRAQDGAAGMPPNALRISGPSKTADIEQTLAYGVHGPKRPVVVARGHREGDV